jgi:hypothetical protein
LRSNEVRLNEKARAADLVTQAAVHVSYNEMAKADALIEGMPPDRIPLSLEAADTLKALAEWNLTQGRWKVAAKRFSALVPVITSVDMMDTDRMSRTLMPAATAIKEWGDPAQYDLLRELAIRRFADSSNHGVAAQVTKAVLLEPADEATLKAIAPLSAVLESALKGPELEGNPYLASWRQFSLALMAYRQGQLETAGYWTRRSLASPFAHGQLAVSNHIVLAMIDFRQGREKEARDALVEARQMVEAWEKSPFQIGTSVDFWFDWGNARILLKEAERMLEGAKD